MLYMSVYVLIHGYDVVLKGNKREKVHAVHMKELIQTYHFEW